MDSDRAVHMLIALGHETRLRAFRSLVRARGPVPSGTLADSLEVPPQTLSFHLKELRRAGIVEATRRGRQVVYAPAFQALDALTRYLMEDCCKGGQRR